jgi:translation initiation factor 5B
MAPKTKPDTKKAQPSLIATLKARVEAQRKAEAEALLQEAEELKKNLEEEKLAEMQRKFEIEEKEKQKELDKKEKSNNKDIAKRNQNLEVLLKMKYAGMLVPMTPELEEFEKNYKQQQQQQQQQTVTDKSNKQQQQQQQQQTVTDKLNEQEELVEEDPNLRAPICCVLGHVDTGKTSLLDKLRQTNVQQGEAGGITQQIGATYFPRSSLIHATKELNKEKQINITIPGTLLLDTPGHESFSNLRNRGSSICDLAILVIDIMHGLEQQTRESIRMLRQKKCPFIVALNKIDRLYGWKVHENMDIQQSFSLQSKNVLGEFTKKLEQVKLQLSEEGLNSEVYYNNTDNKSFVSIVPISAKTGEGITDLILLKIMLVQQFMKKKISCKDEFKCTILEIKPIQELGQTMDVILVDGILKHGDTIVLCGANGPIVTRIKSLLTPNSLCSQVKGKYVRHEMIKAAQSIKICADGIDTAIPGTSLYVANTEEDIKKYEKEVMKDVKNISSGIAKDKIGVTVQSSSLGSLEALLSFLEQMGIPVGCVHLGTVHKKHIAHALLMKQKAPKYACILAFDVQISQDASTIANKEKINIFSSNIIYHLFDNFTKHIKEHERVLKEKNKLVAIFPVILQSLCCFYDKDPMVIGCRVLEGRLKPGTPLCVIEKSEDGKKNKITVGVVLSLQSNKKEISIGEKGMDLAIKLSGKRMIHEGESERVQLITYGRQFGDNSILISDISRQSIDALKDSFRDEMKEEDWKLVIKLKEELGVL